MHAPFKKIEIERELPLWLTHDFFSACDERDYFKLYKRTKSIEDKTRANRAKNFSNTLNDNLKKEYFSNHINQNKHDSKKLWKVLKKLVPGKDNNKGNIEIQGCSTAYESVCALNDHFITVGAKVADKIPGGNKTVIPEILKPCIELNQVPLSRNKVLEELKGIKCSKVTGLDGLNAR